MEVFSPAMDFEAVVVLVTSILLGLRPYLLIVLGIFIFWGRYRAKSKTRRTQV